MLKITTYLQSEFLNAELDRCYTTLLKRSEVGFTKLPFDQKALTQSLQMADQLKSFDHLVVVGIGGSSMGPRALAEIASSTKISFLDNVDSLETEKIIQRQTDLSRTAWLIISKSGTTIEVLWSLDLLEQIYNEKKIKFWPNCFFITEHTDNPLQNLALKHQRPSLPIPLDVGGRFSVLSPVGLVVAEYLNLSAKNLLLGAEKALAAQKQVLESVAQYLSSFRRHEDITLFWFYNSNMRWFGCWLQQLWAESLGKKTKLDGTPAPDFSSPMISIGTCDQHSIMQQVVDGPKNKFVNIFRFHDVEKSAYKILNSSYAQTKILEGLNFGDLIKAEAIATEQAFRQSGVNTVVFEVESCNAENMGFLFMFFQLVVATLAEVSRINAFDQPGVALTKKLTLDYLRQIR